MSDLCACGCGTVIHPSDPDPYFRWQHCQHLWRESILHPDPQRWREEQRVLSYLVYHVMDWEHGLWERELVIRDVLRHAPIGEMTFEAGLADMYLIYDALMRDCSIPRSWPTFTDFRTLTQ